MKPKCPHCFRTVSAALILLFAFTFSALAQPMHYNFATGGGANSFPFNQPSGKLIQTLLKAGDFNTPAPAPSGQSITKYYVRIATGYPLGPATYTNFSIRFSQTALTVLPTGSYYTGTWTTVYTRASVTLTAAADTWLEFTLDAPYPYDPTMSLVVEIINCGASGTTTGFSLAHTTVAAGNNGRTYSVTGPCPQVYQGISSTVVNCGIDVAPATVTCNYSWANQTSGTTSLLYSVKAVSNLVGWAAGAAATVRRTTDGGATWGNGNPNPGVIVGDIYNVEAIDGNTAFVTTSGASTFIYKTTNGGTNWVQVYSLAGGFINAIKMVSATNGYAFGDPVGGNWLLLKTTDGGSTWTSLATIAGTGDGRNNCVQVSLPHMWFGSGQNTLWHSTNSGLNWTFATTTGITGQVTGVRFNSVTTGLVGGATMSKSTDGGATFTLLPALGTGTITGIQGTGSDTYWYTRGTGIFYSTNAGTSWTQVHTHTAAQNDISLVTGSNGCMTGWSAGTSGTIAKLTGNPVGINNNNNSIPAVYNLEQNYPNPFNPVTNINFAIPKAGITDLRVYDALGKEVSVLFSGYTPAGNHTVQFDGSQLSSGVYFYTLKTNEFTSTKKMLLVK